MPSLLWKPAIALAALLATISTAGAQDLSGTITCLRGSVPASDYAELGQKLRESLWDRKGGVALTASAGGVRLRVVDPYQVSVCEETANNATSCTFRITQSVIDEFTIVVDNTDNGTDITYKLCAY